MSRLINKIKLFPNNNERSKEIEEVLKTRLEIANFEVVHDSKYDLAIAIGGDGSFLRMVKNNAFDSETYYVGVNAGTLGFLQEISIEDIDIFIERLNNNDFNVQTIGVQETKVTTKDGNISRFFSLNEIVVRDKNLKTTKLNIEIDNELLEKYIGDGVLISTSIGSTAYNLSFGGAIVYDDLHTLQITPIAPLNTKSYRDILNSIIIPENRTITIKPTIDGTDNLLVIVDGENNIYKDVLEITTIVRNKKIKCIRMSNFSYARKINEKFLSEK